MSVECNQSVPYCRLRAAARPPSPRAAKSAGHDYVPVSPIVTCIAPPAVETVTVTRCGPGLVPRV